MVGLIGGQNARRLIKDQDFGLPVQRLQDFDPLLVSDGQVFDQRVRVHIQFVFAAEVFQSTAGLRQRRAQQAAIFGAQHHVFQHREILHQLEMLEHHADTGADGALAVGDQGGFAVDENLARVRLVEPVQDRHQR